MNKYIFYKIQSEPYVWSRIDIVALHAFIASRYAYYDPYRDRYRKYYEGGVGLGVDGIVGLEYKIPKAPIALSLDVKPFVEFVSRGYIYSSLDPGLGIKITF